MKVDRQRCLADDRWSQGRELGAVSHGPKEKFA